MLGTRIYETLVDQSKTRELLSIADYIRDSSTQEIIFVFTFFLNTHLIFSPNVYFLKVQWIRWWCFWILPIVSSPEEYRGIGKSLFRNNWRAFWAYHTRFFVRSTTWRVRRRFRSEDVLHHVKLSSATTTASYNRRVPIYYYIFNLFVFLQKKFKLLFEEGKRFFFWKKILIFFFFKVKILWAFPFSPFLNNYYQCRKQRSRMKSWRSCPRRNFTATWMAVWGSRPSSNWPRSRYL